MKRVFTRAIRQASVRNKDELSAFIRTLPENLALAAIDDPEMCQLERGLLAGKYEVSLDAMTGLMDHLYPGISSAIQDADESDDPGRYKVITRLWNTAIYGRADRLKERSLLLDMQSKRVLAAPPAKSVYATRTATERALLCVEDVSPIHAWWWDGGIRVLYKIENRETYDCGLLMEYSTTRRFPFRAYRVLFAYGCSLVLPFFSRAVRDSVAVRPGEVRDLVRPVLDIDAPEDRAFIDGIREGTRTLAFRELNPMVSASERRGAHRRARALLRTAGVPSHMTSGIVSLAVSYAAQERLDYVPIRTVLQVVGSKQGEVQDPELWWVLGSSLCKLVRDGKYGWEKGDNHSSESSAAVGGFDAREAASAVCTDSEIAR